MADLHDELRALFAGMPLRSIARVAVHDVLAYRLGEAADRIDTLETALRKIANSELTFAMRNIAREALGEAY